MSEPGFDQNAGVFGRTVRPAAGFVVALLLAAALLAVSCGVGDKPEGARSKSTGAVSGPARSELLAISPVTADEVLAVVREAGRPVVLNVWATWCLPCRQEFPDLMRLYRERDLKLVLVSADFPDQVDQARSFLVEQGVDFPSFLKTGADMEFIDRLSPSWSGALPATFIYDAAGELRHFWEGGASFETMVDRFDAALAGGG